MMPSPRLLIVTLATLAAGTAELSAQQRFLLGEPLPREVAEGVVDFLNDPAVVRFDGRASLPEGSVLDGDVGVLDGSFDLAGRVVGDIVVVGGDLDLAETAQVTGNVLLIGGRLGGEESRISGTFTRYDETFTFVVRDGVVALRRPPDRREGLYLGRSRLTLRAGTNYNRVEGLPIVFGPVIDSRDSDAFRVEALAIYRTESDFTRDRYGYRIGVEQRFGSPLNVRLRGQAYSEVVPIESWLTDLEASLATFFLRDDYRDYYERRGWRIGVGLAIPSVPLDLSLDYRREKHFSLPVGSPWTLTGNDEPWRPMPLVAEGTQQSIEAALVIDTRNDEDAPTDGWFLTASTRFGVGDDLLLPGFGVGPEAPIAEPTAVDGRFRTGRLDLRRYARVDPYSHLSFRALLTGSIDNEPLPPQYQHAFGGEAAMPGFRPFELDCGARDTRVFAGRDASPETFAQYGCDRMALFQIEYRKTFSWDLEIGPEEDEWERWSWYPRIDLSPAFSLFVEGGRGWAADDSRPDTEDVADAGVGLHLGDLSFYWAYPLRGGNEQGNFFVRFARRF